MARKKFTVEYIIRSSPAILFEFVTNPSLLAQWFADGCDQNGDLYTFSWSGSKENAELVEWIEEEKASYHWQGARKNEFFSFKIYKSEISNDTILEVTDFAEDKEIKDQIRLWDSQIEDLKYHLGAS